MDDTDPRITALQLLLSDADEDLVCDVFCKAFPSVFIPMKAVAQQELVERLSRVDLHLGSITDVADGTSPLGILAVKSVHESATAAKNNIRHAEMILGVRTYTKR